MVTRPTVPIVHSAEVAMCRISTSTWSYIHLRFPMHRALPLHAVALAPFMGVPEYHSLDKPRISP
jgi:hypothetical protein